MCFRCYDSSIGQQYCPQDGSGRRQATTDNLALTKADLIQDEESIVEHIFERVLGSSKETQDLGGLAGCVAVVNRLHQDKLSLLEAEQAEAAVFNALFE